MMMMTMMIMMAKTMMRMTMMMMTMITKMMSMTMAIMMLCGQDDFVAVYFGFFGKNNKKLRTIVVFDTNDYKQGTIVSVGN